MKPGDHPEFFRLPPPEGRSRESTIRLDGDGRFWHNEAEVEHRKLAAAMHTWVARHPDDGRFILNNGFDWTYFTVDDAPYTVRGIRPAGAAGAPVLVLSDGTEEAWDAANTRAGKDGALYTAVKPKATGGPFDAKFTRHAQTELGPILLEKDGAIGVTVGGTFVPLPFTA